MKKVLLTIAAIALLAAPASAQVYSIWGDEGMTLCNLEGDPVPNTMFHVFVFVEPNEEGCFGGEYKFPEVEGHFNLGTTPSDALSDAVIGVWYGGGGVNYATTSCQSDVFWVVDMHMMAGTAAYYVLEPYDDTGNFSVTSCIYPRPILPATLYNHFGVFNPCVIGTEETSWGAIKSMMD